VRFAYAVKVRADGSRETFNVLAETAWDAFDIARRLFFGTAQKAFSIAVHPLYPRATS
jgi:hypothetical protein